MEYTFSYYLSTFLGKYLPTVIGTSFNTVSSYRDTFVSFLRYMKEKKGISAEHIKLKELSQSFVADFLDWIENERHCSATTRNV